MKYLNVLKKWSLFSLVLLILNGCASNYKLTVEDTLARPGERTRLAGRLLVMESTVLNQKPSKQELGFYIDNLFVGINETNRDGYATVAYYPKKIGTFHVKAIYNAKTYQAQARGRLFVWNRNDPILVVDVDSTAQSKKHATVPFVDQDASTPAPGASETLRELSRQFRIVYLTNHPRETIPSTRTWLEQNDFPAGPVLVWEIEKLQTDFAAIRVGIGTTDQDFQQYREHKIFSILLDPDRSPAPIDGGIRVSDWPAVLKSLRNVPRAGNGP